MVFVNGVLPTLWQDTPGIREKENKGWRGADNVTGSITKGKKKKEKVNTRDCVCTYILCILPPDYIF